MAVLGRSRESRICGGASGLHPETKKCPRTGVWFRGGRGRIRRRRGYGIVTQTSLHLLTVKLARSPTLLLRIRESADPEPLLLFGFAAVFVLMIRFGKHMGIELDRFRSQWHQFDVERAGELIDLLCQLLIAHRLQRHLDIFWQHNGDDLEIVGRLFLPGPFKNLEAVLLPIGIKIGNEPLSELVLAARVTTRSASIAL